jgi:hypothetical protein
MLVGRQSRATKRGLSRPADEPAAGLGGMRPMAVRNSGAEIFVRERERAAGFLPVAAIPPADRRSTRPPLLAYSVSP